LQISYFGEENPHGRRHRSRKLPACGPLTPEARKLAACGYETKK
jgi:hypothetical protein